MMRTPQRITAILISFALLATAAFLPGCENRAASAGKQVLKIGYVLPDEHPTAQAMEFFKKRVEELSDGQVEVRLFSNSQLGSASELISSCQSGNVEAAVVSAAPLAQNVPELNVLVMPFIFRDSAHQHAILDGPIGKELRDYVGAAKLTALTFFDAGSRNIMTKTGPIKEPADLAGLKIRVMDSNALLLAVARLGATPQPMSQGEVYGALQTGVIDGWENNPTTCLNFSMQETGCKYFAWTRHVSIPDVFIISTAWYNALPTPLKEAVDTAAAETRDYQRKLWEEDEEQAIAKLKAAGMEFNEVDTKAFTDRIAGFYDTFVTKYGKNFGTLVQQIQEQENDGGHP